MFGDASDIMCATNKRSYRCYTCCVYLGEVARWNIERDAHKDIGRNIFGASPLGIYDRMVRYGNAGKSGLLDVLILEVGLNGCASIEGGCGITWRGEPSDLEEQMHRLFKKYAQAKRAIMSFVSDSVNRFGAIVGNM